MTTHEKIGFIGGSLLSLLGSVKLDDLITTSVLAITGASVSFMSSVILKFLSRCFKKDKDKK
ncbi:hypothetical protein ACFSQ0_05295 [Mesonia sediminis]|uniref:Uncharacterized protein n=1 Tax=Mesonia sediminis TaxID=1703946 RepID=A0ABW5SCC6_9FLAO